MQTKEQLVEAFKCIIRYHPIFEVCRCKKEDCPYATRYSDTLLCGFTDILDDAIKLLEKEEMEGE